MKPSSSGRSHRIARSRSGRSLPRPADVDFSLIAESIPHIVWVAGPTGDTEYFNRRGAEYTGLPQDANNGWGWLSLLHPDDVEASSAAWAHATETESALEMEYRVRRFDGEYRWMCCRGLPVRDKDGQVYRWIGTCTDIHEEKQLESHLREAEHQSAEALTLLEALQTAAPVGFGFVDRDLRYLRVNETLAAMNGAPVSAHIGRTAEDLVPALWDQIEPVYRSVLESGQPALDLEFQGGTPGTEGQVRYWLVNCYPVRMDAELVGLGIVVIDITERKRAEDFRSVVMANMVEGLYALDDEGCLTFMNEAASRMLGWREDELRGKPMHAAIHFQRADGTPLPEEECALLKPRIAPGRPVRVADDAFTCKDGSILPVAYSAAPLEAVGGGGVVVVFRDATEETAERMRAQRELDALTWLGHIRDALDEGRMVLYSQPIVPLAGGEPGEELLLRMIGKNGELILPGSFLPAAEKYGLVAEIDRWVIVEAVRLAAAGRRVNANISAASVGAPDVLALIERELRLTGAPPSNLVIEVTETALMRDIEAGAAFARGLADLGCSLALDDFGTGYGGLTYLKRFPAVYLKIDIDFVRDLGESTANQHLVKAIVNLAQAFGQTTIAEGVEDAATLSLLAEYGVDYAQGYHVGRPAALVGDV